eukprot:CAMPEP_0182489754 /NCGR_PEP_ID=MMETSP1319-20130603/49062_1 /TAXON_ID=172717 /ORGANISM="Bolidomonas pacifica, Strain RCC208" /LENGTH=359 /DNA_ID=CAMNT_0024691879 /DNA_START=240 /DNA_END=1319 /DNA_ORIENTATION=+
MTDAGCEYAADDRTNYLAQPITALSNFSFTFVGFIILEFAVLDIRANGWKLIPDPTTLHRSQLIGSNPLLSLALAGCCTVMGVTSFIWHASLTNKGALVDFGAMYLLIDYIIALCCLRLLAYVKFMNHHFLTFFVHLVAAVGLGIGVWMYDRNQTKRFKGQNTLIMMMIGAIVGLVPVPLLFGFIRMLKNKVLGLVCGKVWLKARNERRKELKDLGVRRRRSWGLGICALISMCGAYWFRKGDTSWICTDLWGPSSGMQAHAIWHSGCAMAVLFVYLFLRSEVFSLYGYVSKHEQHYEGEPMNWIERQVEVAQKWIDTQDEIADEDVETGIISPNSGDETGGMELAVQTKRDSGAGMMI